MSESDELDAIRERKRKQLIQQTTGSSSPDPPQTNDPITVRNQQHFTDIIQQHDVVLVDYHADWCGPCHALDPIVTDIAHTTPATVAKIDIDHHPALAQQANVRGIPTLMLYTHGEPVERFVGMQDKATLVQHIDQHTPT